MRKVKLVALALVASIAFTACGSDSANTEETETEESVVETETTEATDIVAVAVATEGFSTLVAALTAAGLVETLQGEGPFTVFAPNDDAFAALPAGLLDKLLLPENKDLLVKILTYHVVSGTVLAADVTAGDVPTVEGQNITITTDMGVKVNGATVTATDIIASNGVIHVIDAVILPPDVDPSAL
jgi:uncharacterized surface protein with fasciclin (FAS1) repeats